MIYLLKDMMCLQLKIQTHMDTYGVVLNDPYGSIPTLDTLWFCDTRYTFENQLSLTLGR